MKFKKIPSQEYLRSILDYDPRTGILRWKQRPDVPAETNKRWAGKITGSPDAYGYLRVNIHDSFYLAHRLIWVWMTGDQIAADIDHRDRDKSNNRWKNLRESSRSQNHANRAIGSKNTSGFKGVSLFRRDDTWRAQIQVNGENIHLGYYRTPEMAHKIYCKAAKKYFGEFARTA